MSKKEDYDKIIIIQPAPDFIPKKRKIKEKESKEDKDTKKRQK